MDTMDITFGDDVYEVFARQLKDGESVSAAALLTAMDTLDETAAEDFLLRLHSRGIIPDLSDLPQYSADSEAALRLRREQQLAQQGDLRGQLSEPASGCEARHHHHAGRRSHPYDCPGGQRH